MKSQFDKTNSLQSNYGAKEIIQYQKNAVINGFTITIVLFVLIGFFLSNLKNDTRILTNTFSTGIIEIENSIKPSINKPISLQPQEVNGTIYSKAGSGEKAGNPKPILDNASISKTEFAETKNLWASFSDGREGDKVVISTNPNATNIVIMNEPNATITYPEANDFIIYEKQPNVDLRKLSSLLEYPYFAKKANIEGNVTIQVLISENGLPLKTEILDSENAVFNQAAIDAVMKMQYEPAIQNGTKVPSWIVIPIIFKLSAK